MPIREDANVGNGELHSHDKWEWLREELYARFGGWNIAPNLYPGGWIDPETGERIEDESRKHFVDFKREDLNKMRRFIKKVAIVFKQKCIRFEHEGEVEYILREVK